MSQNHAELGLSCVRRRMSARFEKYWRDYKGIVQAERWLVTVSRLAKLSRNVFSSVCVESVRCAVCALQTYLGVALNNGMGINLGFHNWV